MHVRIGAIRVASGPISYRGCLLVLPTPSFNHLVEHVRDRAKVPANSGAGLVAKMAAWKTEGPGGVVLPKVKHLISQNSFNVQRKIRVADLFARTPVRLQGYVDAGSGILNTLFEERAHRSRRKKKQIWVCTENLAEAPNRCDQRRHNA